MRPSVTSVAKPLYSMLVTFDFTFHLSPAIGFVKKIFWNVCEPNVYTRRKVFVELGKEDPNATIEDVNVRWLAHGDI